MDQKQSVFALTPKEKPKKDNKLYQPPELIKLDNTQPETGGTNVPENGSGLVS